MLWKQISRISCGCQNVRGTKLLIKRANKIVRLVLIHYLIKSAADYRITLQIIEQGDHLTMMVVAKTICQQKRLDKINDQTLKSHFAGPMLSGSREENRLAQDPNEIPIEHTPSNM